MVQDRCNYNWTGTCTHPTQWCSFEWPWV